LLSQKNQKHLSSAKPFSFLHLNDHFAKTFLLNGHAGCG
jgi:hypothetical protein